MVGASLAPLNPATRRPQLDVAAAPACSTDARGRRGSRLRRAGHLLAPAGRQPRLPGAAAKVPWCRPPAPRLAARGARTAHCCPNHPRPAPAKRQPRPTPPSGATLPPLAPRPPPPSPAGQRGPGRHAAGPVRRGGPGRWRLWCSCRAAAPPQPEGQGVRAGGISRASSLRLPSRLHAAQLHPLHAAGRVAFAVAALPVYACAVAAQCSGQQRLMAPCRTTATIRSSCGGVWRRRRRRCSCCGWPRRRPSPVGARGLLLRPAAAAAAAAPAAPAPAAQSMHVPRQRQWSPSGNACLPASAQGSSCPGAPACCGRQATRGSCGTSGLLLEGAAAAAAGAQGASSRRWPRPASPCSRPSSWCRACACRACSSSSSSSSRGRRSPAAAAAAAAAAQPRPLSTCPGRSSGSGSGSPRSSRGARRRPRRRRPRCTCPAA
jgi:hypothetical protein